MARYADGKTCYSAVLTLFETCQPNNITTLALSPQNFAHSGRHYLWVQNGVISFARGAHLNMLWICFVFVEPGMRSGACIEPWEIHYHIWGVGFHNGNSASTSTRTPYILPHKCPNGLKFCTEVDYMYLKICIKFGELWC